MSKKNKQELAIASYAERIAPEKRAVQIRHVHDTVNHLEKSEAKLIEGGKCWLDSVEEMRQAGLSWLAGSDKNQYDLYFYGFIETLVKPEHRKILTREIVKTAIHFATVIPEPIKDLQTAFPFVKKVGDAFQQLRTQKRGLENEHIPPSLFAEFESVAKTACAKLRALEKDFPIERMDANALDVLIKEWMPVYEKIDAAIKLRKQKMIEA